MTLRGMAGTLVFSWAILLSSLSFADEIKVPFAIYVEEFKAEAKEKGFDLYEKRESDGFIVSRGAEFSVFTFKEATPEQLELIKFLAFKHQRD